VTDDFCGECPTCHRISLLANPQTLVEQGLVERGESAEAATVERVPLILQTHPDVWALVPDPVRLKSPVARPMLRVGQLRAVQRRRSTLRILERAAHGQGFAQLFSDTSALAKDRDSSFEDQLGVFYGLLTDLLEITSKVQEPVLRNAPLAIELQLLGKTVDSAWVRRAIAGFDEIYAGARRNLNRQIGRAHV